MPSAQLTVLSAAALDDAVCDHFQNAMAHLDEKKARQDLGGARSAGHHAFERFRPRVGSVRFVEQLLRPFRAGPAAGKRRPSQRPGLRCGADIPPGRRSRATGTRIGGLPRRRPGTRVPSETTRSGARSSAWHGASKSARTCAIQPSRGVLDCMAETKHQTAYRTVKAPDADPSRSKLVPALKPGSFQIPTL